MKTNRFSSNSWIIFDFKGSSAIGRTATNTRGKECIVFVSDTGESKRVLYSTITNARKLCLLGNAGNQVITNTLYSLN